MSATPPDPPDLPTQVDTTADDWWDDLYGKDAPDTAEAPAPRRTAAPAGRLPFWWTGEGVALGGELDEVDTEPVPPLCEHPEPLEVHDSYGELVTYLCPECDAQLPVDTDDDKAEPTEAAEAESREPKQPKEPNPRLRWLAFNATAAGAGHLAIWSVAGDPMAGVTYIARMSISVPQLAAGAVTLGAAVAAWKAAKLICLHHLPGLLGLAARPAAALGAAVWGQGTAPLITDAMALTHPWSTLLAPLLAVGPVAAACWWALDRNTTKARLPVRWAARIPLATVALSSALYAPGALQ